MMRVLTFVLILACAMFATACAEELPRARVVKKGDREYVRTFLDRLIRARMANHDLQALSIVLVSGNETIMAQGYGSAKIGRNPGSAQPGRVDEHSVYAAASISKIFTAMAVMRLAEQGKLDIDAPVKKILPWFPGTRITARHLLTHRSGLPANIMNGFTHKGEPPPLTSLVHHLTRLPLAEEPSQEPVYRYSNLGFAVLGLMVQKITRTPFADYMRHEILLPLGMRHSGFRPHPELNKRLVMGNRNGNVVGVPIPRDLPAGALLTSAADLGEFMKSILAQRKLISKKSLEAMLRPQNSGSRRDAGFEIGLAWFRNTFGMEQGGRKAGHAGDLPPYHGFMMTLPDHGLGVAILCNSDGSQAPIIYTAMTALELALQSERGIPPITSAKSKPVKMEPAQLERLAGNYATGMGLVRVHRKDDALMAPLFGIPMELTPMNDGTFQPSISVFGLFKFRVADIEPLRVRFPRLKDARGKDARGEKTTRHSLGLLMSDFLVTSGAPVEKTRMTPAWRNRLGDYRITNQSGIGVVTDFRLREQDGFLLVSAKPAVARGMRIDLPLRIISDERARVMGTGEFIRAHRRHLLYSGYVLEKTTEE